jgi:dTMP kinase
LTPTFITFEGPEGAGKSLQVRLLVDRLRATGRVVVETREPGGTPLGDQLRHLLLVRSDLHTVARAEALMMCAARAQLVEAVIKPALERHEVVVCDRFSDSTLAYQGYGRGLDLDELRAVLSFATAGLEPDMTILLDLPVTAGLARKHVQSASSPAWTRFEAETLAFHERIGDGYRTLAAAAPERWVRLDASKPPDQLADQVLQRVAPRLGMA